MIKPGTRGFVEGAACRVENASGKQGILVVRMLQDLTSVNNNYHIPGECVRVPVEDFTPAKHDIEPGNAFEGHK